MNSLLLLFYCLSIFLFTSPVNMKINKDFNYCKTESGNRTQATLVGAECSHHDATTALNFVCYVLLSLLTVLSVQRVTGATKS